MASVLSILFKEYCEANFSPVNRRTELLWVKGWKKLLFEEAYPEYFYCKFTILRSGLSLEQISGNLDVGGMIADT